MGFSEEEIGRMTLNKFMKLYSHYKDYYDFTLKKVSYADIEFEYNHQGEFLID